MTFAIANRVRGKKQNGIRGRGIVNIMIYDTARASLLDVRKMNMKYRAIFCGINSHLGY